MATSRKPLTIVYAVLALLALVATWSQNIAFMQLPDPGGVAGFMRLAYANPAAASLSNDVLFVALAAFVFMIVEGRRTGVKYVWLYIVLSFAIAISVMLPLFLIARENKLAAKA
jgi:hypothetical protein